MKKIIFTATAIDEIKAYKSGNQNLVFKIFELVSDIQHTPFSGLGKPEALKGKYHGVWSRRISDEHRLLYKISEEGIEIISCSGHYDH